MDAGGLSWSLLTVIGPLVLAAVILWAVLRNRTSRREKDRTEQATRDLYNAEDRAHRGEDDRVP